MTTAVRDYSIVGPERERAIARGLAGADWYTTPVPRDELQRLMERRNGPAAVHTALWLALLIGAGVLVHLAWGTWWLVPALALYGPLYGSACDARWHECGHRTAFRSRRANDAVYLFASFLCWREPVSWRWSHVRHHSDTIIVGRDTEIAFPRPIRLRTIALELFGLLSVRSETAKIVRNAAGRFDAAEADYLPATERPAAVWAARVWLVLVAGVAGLALGLRSLEPLALAVGPTFYGRWLMVAYGVTQHAGLAEDTLDHRLNTRSVRMNRLHRFLYLNMNFHVEHHMFPTVPYHALPALNRAVAADLPPLLPGFRAAYAEVLRAWRLQRADPGAFIDRRPLLPEAPPSSPADAPAVTDPAAPPAVGSPAVGAPAGGWVDAGPVDALAPGTVRRLDHDGRVYALYRLADGRLCATDGLCTHAAVALCDGFVDGGEIECPKHNGRFDIATGRALTRPVTVDLGVHPVRQRSGRIEVQPPT